MILRLRKGLILDKRNGLILWFLCSEYVLVTGLSTHGRDRLYSSYRRAVLETTGYGRLLRDPFR